MAHPGYPQQMQQPMMGPPMGGPPMGAMMPPRPMRRGTPRAVPIVVSAGLAVGVFCGLLFGLGTGEPKASAEPAKGNNVKGGGDDTTSGAAPAGLGATAATPVGGTQSAPAGPPGKNPNAIASGAKPATAGGAPTVQTAKTVKLTIKIEPDGAASSAKIVVDGKEITGTEIEVPIDHKQVKVAVTANGYHSFDKKLDIVADGSEMTMTVEMVKRGGGGGAPASPGFGGASTGGNHVPTAPPKPKKPANNGIIDI